MTEGEAPPLRARIWPAAIRTGFSVARRLGYIPTEWSRRARLISHLGATLVLDVGAHLGDWSYQLRRAGYEGRIVSFEPLAAGYARLEAAAASDPNWVCRRIAVGDRDGTVEMNVSENPQSSSLLSISERHRRSAPESAYVSRERVPMTRLDTIWDELATSSDRVFIKLDVQGFELHALRGAEASLASVVGMHVELSLVPLYEDGPLYLEVVENLRDRGFRLAGVDPVLEDAETGELLQMDGIFVRDRAAGEGGGARQ